MSQHSQPLCAMTIGLHDRAEFLELRETFANLLPEGLAGHWTTITDYLHSPSPFQPELIIVWQSAPDEYTEADVLSLLGRHPLAVVSCLAGHWCESDGRTRSVWPTAVRVPLWQAAERLQRDVSECRSPSSRRLAWTASREEVWLNDLQDLPKIDLTGLRCRLLIPDTALREAIMQQLGQAGVIFVSEQEWPDSETVVILDVDPYLSHVETLLVNVLNSLKESRAVGLTGWCPPHLQEQLLECGLSAVVPKLQPISLLKVLQPIRPANNTNSVRVSKSALPGLESRFPKTFNDD